MAIELWIGQEFDTTHERRALEGLVADMDQKFGQRDEPFFILANYYIYGRQVDLTVLKRDAIVVIELKECTDPFRAVENGAWLTIPDGRMIGVADQNPFAQAKDYRFKFIDLLREKGEEFLPTAKARSMDLSHVSAFVAISPSLHPDTQNELPSYLPWFRLVGLDELSKAVGQQTSPRLNFSEQELRCLVSDVLNLTPSTVPAADSEQEPSADSSAMDVQTPLSSRQRPIALKIITSLRSGVPPSEDIELYTVGRDELLAFFGQKFNEVREFGLSDVKFIQADFGGGKTHFLDLLTNLALGQNFVVSQVTLHSKDAPFDKLDMVIRRIMGSILTPTGAASGLEYLLNTWSETQKGKRANEMYEELDPLPLFPDFRMKVVEYATARNDVSGPRYAACQQTLKWFRGEETPSKKFKSAKEYLAAFIVFVRHLGYSGFIIMLDEAEAITSLSRITNRDLANENIRQVIDNDTDSEGFYFIFASTPTFLSGEGIHGAQEYDALWRRISPALGYLELGSLESVIIDLPALADDQLLQLAQRIRDLYEVAYGLRLTHVEDSHIAALVGYVERRASQRNIRALVRSMVTLLDEARQHSSLDPMTRYEALVETILREEEKARAR